MHRQQFAVVASPAETSRGMHRLARAPERGPLGSIIMRVRTILTLLTGLAIASPVLAIDQASLADPSVWNVTSAGHHRIILVRECNPAHCTTDAFLESLSEEIPPKHVATAPISEITSEDTWAFVESVTVVPDDTRYHFDLRVVDTHGSEQSFTLRVTPTNGARYKAVKRDIRSITDDDP